MLAVYTRRLKLPPHSFFLFGPRGTGKTTWLKQKLPRALWFDLLKSEDYFALLREPQRLRMAVEAQRKGSWVVVDEVQKLPKLLDEIHSLIFSHGSKYKFALSGSSARKLKRAEANLLAGRVIQRTFFPLTGAEMDFSITPERLLQYGSLPQIVSNPKFAVDVLETYVATYLKEEIQQEALVGDIGSFTRFLEIAAIMNGQVTNVAGIARDAAVARPTVQRYFDTLVDTLIGIWVRPWVPHLKVRESAHPKFYFFDPGVVRALTHRLHDRLTEFERGPLLKTLVLHELRGWISIANAGGEIRYWRTPAGIEVDFIWSRGKRAIGFEVKSSRQWKSAHARALKELLATKAIQRAYAVYLGERPLRDGGIDILPLTEFQRWLAAGRIID